ncbi:MAG: helix-turn-helix domain-containing protein [Nanoarchaeota archaeon]|nr:helix-turn-helix domain-containing protein [Nanoarchaeota archaeon]
MTKKTQPESNQVAWIILKTVKHLKVGKYKLAQFLKGSKSKEIYQTTNEVGYGGLMWYDIPTIIGFIEQLEAIGLVHRKEISGSFSGYSIFEVTEAGEKVLHDKTPIALQIIKEKKPIYVGGSEKETLRLLREGKTACEIAKERNLAESTIYTHFFRLIATGGLSSNEVVAEEKIKQVLAAADAFDKIPSVKEVKERLPEASYDEIRCVLADVKRGSKSFSVKNSEVIQ